MKWKAKVDGRWYEVVDVEDQGDGLPNLYHLRNRAPVEQGEVEDLDVAASASFIPQLEVLANLAIVAAKRKDRRLEMLKKEAEQKRKRQGAQKPQKPERNPAVPAQKPATLKPSVQPLAKPVARRGKLSRPLRPRIVKPGSKPIKLAKPEKKSEPKQPEETTVNDELKNKNPVEPAKDQPQQQTAPDSQESAREKLGTNEYGNFPAKREDVKVHEPEIVDDEKNEQDPFSSEDEDALPDDISTRIDRASFQKIRSMENPKLLIVAFRGNQENRIKFLDRTKSLLNTRHAALFMKGEKGNLQGVYVYFFAGAKEDEFLQSIKGTATDYLIENLPENFFSQESPFDSLSLHQLQNTLAGDETLLKRRLNEVLRRMNQNDDSAGEVAAIRMSSEIPLDYARFLSTDHRTVEYYLGGFPSNAGSPGTQFVLADEQESRMFKKTMNGFKPPAPFFNDLYYVSDIDPDFKNFDPLKISPSRALILQANKKFDMEAHVTLNAQARWLVEESKKKGGPNFENQNIVTEQQLLEAFVRVFMKRSPGSKPGKFIKTRYYTGNDWIHLNKDQSIAILWGARTSAISLEKNKVLKYLPFVKDALLTFLK